MNTVLVLGAGSSVHADYPLGGALMNDLCRRRGTDELSQLPNDWTAEEANELLHRLSRSPLDSIDAFLETVPEHAGLGKYLLASEIKRHENVDRLFRPHESGWYPHLFNAVFSKDGARDLAENQVCVITFNYDRSLEVYLYETLRDGLQMTAEDATAALGAVPIIHAYGSLGSYPEIPYVSDCEPTDLFQISEQIQIIHEVADQDTGFCNEAFGEAHGHLSEAQRIIFLGFGFHTDNVRRFNFFTPDPLPGVELFATAYNLGAIQRTALLDRMEPFGFQSGIFSGHSCDTFFAERTGLF